MASIDEILAAETPEFGRAVRAIITGNIDDLRSELATAPELIRARSVSPHRATLLHYVSANGIESELQFAVPNADEIAALLIAAGAEVDAPCDAYAGLCRTPMDLLVSSDHPTEAGVAGRLVDLLCSAGAAVDGPDGRGSPLATALYFGTLDCVCALIAHGARTDNAAFAAAAGRTDWVQSWLDGANVMMRPPPGSFPLSSDRAVAAEQALVFASMCGQTEVVRLLLDHGVNVNANPPGSHWTATPLHTAAIQGQTVVVDLLLRRGADRTLRDSRYQSAPIGWLPHARAPRRALTREVAVLLGGDARAQTVHADGH
ncbi:MAG: ankyrin repeat domain-containing protein [Xanthobacteraceae bacterium]|nr:ankyrin repeat domain-containing protein [Xanthobacteraceae bacterium]